jgi:hypothetical protein
MINYLMGTVIRSMMFTGALFIADQFSTFTQPSFWAIFVPLSLLLQLFWEKYHAAWMDPEQIKRRNQYEEEDYQLLRKRLDTIMTITNRNMRKVETGYGRVPPHNLHVLVPHEDLMKIWNIADITKG